MVRGVAIMAVLLLAACSFEGSSGTDSTGADADAGSDLDAIASIPTDARAPRWGVVETLIIDTADSQPTMSQLVLEDGVVYRLRVSGTITNVIDSFQGDADFYDFGNPKDNGCCEDIGLGIDDLVVDDMDTQPDWGPYDPSHIYEVEWTGAGNTIAALFQDTFYGNNIGDLTLEILAFE